MFSVVHQYPFSSEFQRMSVVVQRALSLDLTLFLKGAPEKVADLCTKSSGKCYFQRYYRHYCDHCAKLLGKTYF